MLVSFKGLSESESSSVRYLRLQEGDAIISVPSLAATFDLACEFLASSSTHVHAALPRDEVVAAPSAAWVDELITHLGGGVVIKPRNWSRAAAFVQRVQAEHRNTFFWTAVLLAGCEVSEAIGIALASTVIKGLTLHGGHVEKVAAKEGPACSLLLREPADLGNLWDSETWFLALLIAPEIIGIPLAPSIVENLALLGDSVVVVTLNVRSARSFVHLKETLHSFWWQR